MTMKFDKDFIKRLQAGNTQAESEFYKLLKPEVESTVNRLLQFAPTDSREDLVTEILLAALKSIKTGKFEPSPETSIAGYVFGISRKRIATFVRDTTRRKYLRERHLKPEKDNGEDKHAIEQAELKEILKGLLKQLPNKYKHVLQLRFFEQLDVEEVAERMGITKKQVSEATNYALKLLRKKMTKGNLENTLRDYLNILILIRLTN